MPPPGARSEFFDGVGASKRATQANRAVRNTGQNVPRNGPGERGDFYMVQLPLAGQAMYGLALPKGRGEFSLFGRVERDAQLMATDRVGYTAGGQIRLAF